eukprot:766529-Hanusia_phi.AAC.5
MSGSQRLASSISLVPSTANHHGFKKQDTNTRLLQGSSGAPQGPGDQERAGEEAGSEDERWEGEASWLTCKIRWNSSFSSSTRRSRACWDASGSRPTAISCR